jgi:hypothetical protein
VEPTPSPLVTSSSPLSQPGDDDEAQNEKNHKNNDEDDKDVTNLSASLQRSLSFAETLVKEREEKALRSLAGAEDSLGETKVCLFSFSMPSVNSFLRPSSD